MTTKEILEELQFSASILKMDEKIYRSRNELRKIAQDLGQDFDVLSEEINKLLRVSLHLRNNDPVIQFIRDRNRA